MAKRTAKRKATTERTKRTKTAVKASGDPRMRPAKQAGSVQRWSQDVTEHSDALDLEGGVFAMNSPKAIAVSLKHSAEVSRRRKSDPYRSAMSMLTFYINRAGKNLPTSRKKVLERAKQELRKQFGRA